MIDGLRERVIQALCDTPNVSFAKGTDHEVTVLDVLKVINDSRMTPHTPHHTKVLYKDGSGWVTDECPRCFRKSFTDPNLGIWDILIDRFKPYCRRCGQAIDWSEYSGRGQIDWDAYMARKDPWEYGRGEDD